MKSMTENKGALVKQLHAACRNSKRKKQCAVHLSWYCQCEPHSRVPCGECLMCRAAHALSANETEGSSPESPLHTAPAPTGLQRMLDPPQAQRSGRIVEEDG